ncbi:hypothetical protein Pmar_PMAR009887 [Perkinsus marinus ATCC 50983]|uniref:Uncharacterized protein n=1 Tax=Perkinsus marinus (strain ATCC 50983 / TXsc) TaxID=423536 RepID=C5KIA7_PERM5|nr:hypothetical protein Pmar_PMAR009432 [Perkinsus marinus ATCC 50983]XP_002783974.1 hypothetical protein Pmar_PMAR009887 [Perkinsus marinus ATCC 50983]EER14837.1 hypothetical protein Pmar_PMAR009432 [Perkinsus marinus ATCC 50983]EER15770.1 hypothetical protein Pmar_PMAR009887 [Perkinsus marinus ATCC 50983]|eukprot:XP_002783041.1 hypothetical protein Pmar_PMAR009432 [Perkinsus marinus ATCC 50983]
MHPHKGACWNNTDAPLLATTNSWESFTAKAKAEPPANRKHTSHGISRPGTAYRATNGTNADNDTSPNRSTVNDE